MLPAVHVAICLMQVYGLLSTPAHPLLPLPPFRLCTFPPTHSLPPSHFHLCTPVCPSPSHPLLALSLSLQVAPLEECLEYADIFVTTTGNKDIIMATHMAKMKNNAIVGNIGHFDNEVREQVWRFMSLSLRGWSRAAGAGGVGSQTLSVESSSVQKL